MRKMLIMFLILLVALLAGCSPFYSVENEVSKRLAQVQTTGNLGDVLQYISSPVEYEYTFEWVGYPDQHGKENYTHTRLATCSNCRLILPQNAQRAQPTVTVYSDCIYTRQAYTYQAYDYNWSGVYESWWTTGKNPILYRVKVYENNF